MATLEQWQQALKNAITKPQELMQILELSPEILQDTEHSIQQFAFRVPRGFVDRMEKGNPQDPLLLQVLPLAEEMQIQPGFSTNPLQEQQFNPVPGVLHKYQGRVLLTPTEACAINCRYCFRRYFPYADNNPGRQGWQQALHYIQQDSSIHEVILSGGDPLMLKDAMLAELLEQLAHIPQLKRLRIHSRLPIVLPERITNELLTILANKRFQVSLVTHCNHANEIDQAVQLGLQQLRQIGVTLLNQTVLLKGINDQLKTLIDLSEKLFSVGVLPYYLHLLDPVQGAQHFWLPENQAIELMRILSAKLPGYLVPKLVREVPGARAKQMIAY